MTRTKRMQRIVALADSATQSASQRLSDSRRTLDDNRAKLAQFEAYRDEYLTTLRAGGASMSAARACDLRQFIAQVEQAIRALESQNSSAEQQYREDLQTWNQESRRTRALGDVLERARRDERHHEECSVQREIDDRSAPVKTPR